MLVSLDEAARLTGFSKIKLGELVHKRELQLEGTGKNRGFQLESLRGVNGYQPPQPKPVPKPAGPEPTPPWKLPPVLRHHLVSLNDRDRAVRIAALSKIHPELRQYLRDNPLPPVFNRAVRPDQPQPPPPRPTPPPARPSATIAHGLPMTSVYIVSAMILTLGGFVWLSQPPRAPWPLAAPWPVTAPPVAAPPTPAPAVAQATPRPVPRFELPTPAPVASTFGGLPCQYQNCAVTQHRRHK